MMKSVLNLAGLVHSSANSNSTNIEQTPLKLAFINDMHYNPFYKPKDFEETYHLIAHDEMDETGLSLSFIQKHDKLTQLSDVSQETQDVFLNYVKNEFTPFLQTMLNTTDHQ